MQLIRLLFLGVISLVLVCFVFHRSLIDYFMQTYHINIKPLETNSLFRPSLETASAVASTLDKWRTQIFEQDSTQLQSPYTESAQGNLLHEKPSESFASRESQTHTEKPSITLPPAIGNDDRQFTQSNNQPLKNIQFIDGKLLINKDTEFLLIGDSLMQGIGIMLVRALRTKGLRAYNIAKQNTGLTFTSFFNWARTTQKALEKNPKISVLVVCLGANDPWDVKGIKFGSEKWNTLYNAKIEEVLSIAREHAVFVVWFQVPTIKNEQLNNKIALLNAMYAKNLESHGLFIKTEILTNEGKFSSYIKNTEGKSVLVRAQDGIHLTTKGSEILSNLLLEKIIVQEHSPHNITNISEQYNQNTIQTKTLESHNPIKEHLQPNSHLDSHANSPVINDTANKESNRESKTDKTSPFTSHPFFSAQQAKTQ
ncbi:DUF459 domain-containing protein [Helicobacter aurati]|uniref:DUF459 domain-containing protein n=1 Tax=Helicobacter aurati TaxID=137778 RepID=A0A3D8J5G0_9HELI|nr:DUF459 domain-containing protein [Helicobacter aurati]RDU72688.1 DUF459 domain-containing protein [Helicobacter aurati]